MREQERRSDGATLAEAFHRMGARVKDSVFPSGSGLLTMETAYLGNRLVVQVSILRRPEDEAKAVTQRELLWQE